MKLIFFWDRLFFYYFKKFDFKNDRIIIFNLIICRVIRLYNVFMLWKNVYASIWLESLVIEEVVVLIVICKRKNLFLFFIIDFDYSYIWFILC